MMTGREGAYSTALVKPAAISIGAEDSWVLSMDDGQPAIFLSQKSTAGNWAPTTTRNNKRISGHLRLLPKNFLMLDRTISGLINWVRSNSDSRSRVGMEATGYAQ